jgi:hypothetical protein
MDTPQTDTTQCQHCGATDLYWMTVASKSEAEFIARAHNNPAAMKLAKPRLFHLGGGEHVCPTTPDGFEDCQ